MRTRDSRGRFRHKTNPQIENLSTFFGGRQDSATTPTDRYKNKNGETSTQKALETEVGNLAEETIQRDLELGFAQPEGGIGETLQEEVRPFLITDPKPGNTTFHYTQVPGDPNWVDTTRPLESNPDPVVQQIIPPTVEEEIIESSHQPVGPIGDNNSVRGNQRGRTELWDSTPSPRNRLRYPFFEHPFNRIRREEEEMERREREREKCTEGMKKKSLIGKSMRRKN